MTKARACKVAGQKGSPRVTFHAPESARKCEGINLHIPKGALTLGNKNPSRFLNFHRAIAGFKT